MDTMSKLLGVNRDEYAVSGDKRAWELKARRQIRGVKRELEKRGFTVSPVHYCKGGPAVMGEVSIHAHRNTYTDPQQPEGFRLAFQRRTQAIYVQAFHDLFNGSAGIMYRFEQWPEYLGGDRGHARMGQNHYTGFYNPDIDAIVSSSEEFNRSL
jgi:hypothetical protein